MITAIGFLTFHRLESNLKSNEQDLQSIQIAAGDSAERLSAWKKKTKAALIHAGVEDIVEFALIVFFMAQLGWRLRYALKLSYYITHELHCSL